MLKYIMVGTFVATLLASGLLSMRKTKNVGDFFLGGRAVGPWLSAFAYGTTYFSAVIFIGYAGKVGWGFGTAALWIAFGNAFIGTYLAWKLLAKPTREMTENLGVITMPELLQARYNSQGLKMFAAIIIFVFLVPYSASVYMGLSYFFEQIFHISYNWVLVFMAVVTAIFLVTGGYKAIALTDFIQGIVMLFGVGVMLYYVFGNPQVGGLSQAIAKLQAIDPELTNIIPKGQGGLSLLSLVLLTSLGTWGMPQMVQKFCAIKDQSSIKAATTVASIFALVIGSSAYAVGSVTRLYFSELPIDPATGKATADLLIPQIIQSSMPELAAVLILLLVLSASMSTLSSLVLVSSSTLTVDLLKGYVLPNMNQRQEMLVSRMLCLVFIALSLGIALAKPAIILTLMALSWGTVAGVFLGPYLWGLFWPGTTRLGAWAGALVGLVTSITFAWINNFDAGLVPIGGMLAMIMSIVVVPVVSVFTENFAPEHLQRVFAGLKTIGYGERSEV